jgi:hypothetical protein
LDAQAAQTYSLGEHGPARRRPMAAIRGKGSGPGLDPICRWKLLGTGYVRRKGRRTGGLATAHAAFLSFSQRPKTFPSGSRATANHPIPFTGPFGTTILPPNSSTFLECSSTDSTEM